MVPKEGEEKKQNTGQKKEEKEPPEPLSAEEQMERYEEALKEDDWGHQPC